MKNTFLALLCALLALLSLPSSAVTAGDFYAATVPVEDQSERARIQASREGLVSVLIRLTGSRTLENDPRIESMLRDVATYMVEYSYVTLPATGGSDPGGLGIRVQYDRNGIDQALRSGRLPIWPLNRPPLLLWLVSDDPVTGPQALHDDQIIAVLDSAFARRGLVPVYPLYDLEDQLALEVEQVRDFDGEAIAAASNRYPVQGWLAVRVYETSSGHWRAAWMMDVAGQSLLRQVQAESLEALLGEVVDQAVDSIASRYAYVAGDSAGHIELEISGVATYRDYSRLMALLDSQTMVQEIDIRVLEGDRLRLRLAIEGGRDRLLDSLSREAALQVLPPEPIRSTASEASVLAGESILDTGELRVERLRWISGR